MNTPDLVSPRDALDIIFANRNRAYGAYPLRREYPRTMRRALGWGMLLIGFFITLPHLITALSAALPAEEKSIVYETGLPPVIEVVTPPPVIETPPPPVRATIAYVPPLVLRDEDAPEDVPKAAIDEIITATAEVGNTTREGNEDAPPTLEDAPPELSYVENNLPAEDNDTYDMVGVQKPPTFPGGERDLLRFLAENIKYPSMAREAGIAGNVALTFVINKDGSVSDAQLLKDIGGGCGKEALRVLALMPKWSPGEANGHPVKVRFTLPVRFRLE